MWKIEYTLGLMVGLGCNKEPKNEEACQNSSNELTLADGDNYGFEGQLDIRSTSLAAGSDPRFDWSELGVDLLGHTLDPVSDIDSVSMVVFRDLTEEDIEEGLSTNTLDQASIAFYVSVETGDDTSAHLSDFGLFGNDIDAEQYFEEGYGTWLLALSTGTSPGVGTRMAAFVSPSKGSKSEEISIQDDSAVLTVDASLSQLTPLEVPIDEPVLHIDWSDLSTNGQGGTFEAGTIDKVTVGWYADLSTADLEEQFLDLELIATDEWELERDGETEADLNELSGGDDAFTGVNGDGSWVLALRCTTCTNPTPPFLTLLRACE